MFVKNKFCRRISLFWLVVFVTFSFNASAGSFCDRVLSHYNMAITSVSNQLWLYSFIPWTHSLTHDERFALKSYSVEGKPINQLLTEAGGDLGKLDDAHKSFQNPGYRLNKSKVDLIDNAIYKGITKHSITLFRGVPDDLHEQFLQYQVGDEFSIAGYTSTTLNEHLSQIWGRFITSDPLSRTVYLKILVPKGARLAPLAADQWLQIVANVKEVVLPRNSKFKVVSREEKENKVTQLTVQLLLPQQPL